MFRYIGLRFLLEKRFDFDLLEEAMRGAPLNLVATSLFVVCLLGTVSSLTFKEVRLIDIIIVEATRL